MPDTAGKRIRITLRWIKILDKLEPFFKEEGEFVFRATVSSENRGGFSETIQFPEEGKYYKISDRPGYNHVNLNRVLWEGEVDDHLVIELHGEELDDLSANDRLDDYKRVFRGDPEAWIGPYEPADEGSTDPENMSNWRVGYAIERA